MNNDFELDNVQNNRPLKLTFGQEVYKKSFIICHRSKNCVTNR